MNCRTRIGVVILAALLGAAPCISASAAESARSSLPVPPPVHPRLYVTANDIPALRERMLSDEGRAVLSRMDSLARPMTPEEETAAGKKDFRYYFRMRGLPSRVELLALDYLTQRNTESGREAVVTVLDSLKRTAFGVRGDLSRANGVMLFVGALVYDWCYDLLTASEKKCFVEEFRRIASCMECGWPPKYIEEIGGHSCEWMIMRDILSAGVAIYDEYPDMYVTAMKVITERFVPFREMCYSAGNYHQGSKYLPTRYSSELFAQRIVAAFNGGEGIFSDNQKNLLYDVIYRMRPDGTLLPSGDENPSRLPREENMALPAMMASSFWRDPHLRWLYGRDSAVIDHSLLFKLLWDDPSVESTPPENLPLTRFCPSPFGWMIARTGWDGNSVICEMKVNEQFAGNHQHLDGGSFQIWYRGSLAIDSGIYEGTTGGYTGDHCRNWSKRTIAHNSLLVYNPDEKFAWYRHKGKPERYCSNDGGQRMPGFTGWDPAGSMADILSDEYTVGRTLATGMDDDFSYIKGDITAAYSSKVEKVVRSFVFCNLHDRKMPAALVVFDRIKSADPSFRKVFVLHSINEPELGKDGFFVRRENGEEDGLLRTTVLLPEESVLTAVGGPGHEFEVDGKNWPNSVDGDRTVESGAWRVEESPAEPALEDFFLNVIQISDNRNYRAHRVRKVACDGFVGADFNGRTVFFSKSGDLRECRTEFRVSGRRNVLLCDVDAGIYEISRCGRPVAKAVVREGENTIRFTARRGGYEIRKQEGNE